MPTAKTVTVENINSDIAYHFTDEIKPDLIIVSGTRLIRERMLSLTPRIGILNLHTGLSPYVKGGPNCTNWCIATKQFHLIGNTVMWIDPGIDSGNIVTTEFTEFAGTENLLDIHIKVMEHAHRLYLKAIDRLSKGNHQGVQQSKIAEWKTYFTRQWRLKEKFMLVKNLKAFRETINSPLINKLRNSVTIIPI